MLEPAQLASFLSSAAAGHRASGVAPNQFTYHWLLSILRMDSESPLPEPKACAALCGECLQCRARIAFIEGDECTVCGS